MAGVRRKKTKRKTNIKILKNERKKKKFVKPAIGNEVLAKHWDKAKTLKQNMKELGLAYDPNSDLKKKKQLQENDDEITMETEENTSTNLALITEFERQAANGKKIERHISPDEAKFFMTLMKKHGNNYKKMSRDKLNTYQHTSNHLKRKCEALKSSSYYSKYASLFPELVTKPNDGATMDIS